MVEQNLASYTRPKVKVFYCTKTGRHLAPELVDLAESDGDRMAGAEDRALWPAQLIESLWAGELAG